VTKSMQFLTATGAVAFAAFVMASGASAQGQFPNKPVRIVLQFPAGGLADAVCRIIALPLSQQLGQPVLVDNRPGADGAIAGEHVVKSATVAQLGKVNMQHIPYKGDAPLMVDLVSGRLHLAIASTSPGAPLAKEGKLRVLGTLGTRRSTLFPDAPTMAESGFPQYALISWGAMFGPANMPRDIVERLAREFNLAISRAEVRDALDKYGYELQGSTPQELTAFVREQVDSWKRGVQNAGITPD